MDLTKKLDGSGASVFADNYFSSPTLAALLRDRDINFVGVVRKDRKGLPSFQDDKKMKRGEYEMFHCTKENLIALKWIDNKPVHVISSIMISEISKATSKREKGQSSS